MSKPSQKQRTRRRQSGDFESVAKHPSADDDKARLEAKLEKVATAKSSGTWSEPRPIKRGVGFISIFESNDYGPKKESPTFATEDELVDWIKRQPNELA